MRKAQKKQAEDFVKILAEAHHELKRYIENKDYAATMELLGQCQEGAIGLGNFIEKIEGEGHPSVSLLEDYCELVYQFHEELVINQEVKADKIYKRLRQFLVKIENSIRNDIKTRYEIVFMPYKASMWDSLESIWEAAKEDSECDAYVVPIPYYDRNSDYSFGKFHYEGWDFPDYVEVTDYNTYSLEKRRPDIIYIHNPYDEQNYVTSVEPQFYSYNLKKYTEQLIYVPYCIYDEPNDPDRKETIEFCARYVSSGILNADKVILQSEKFRYAVINALLEYRGMNREFWEKKILALGSPKYDKVLNVDMDKLHIPDSWEKLIRKRDGSRKKVIFYNTSLNALLQYDEQMNRKIKSVLRFFYENKEECVLLWRPHPLVKATIESMRPRLWAEYKSIVDEYREGGWGIYDDTPDFHEAFAVSDAYYGDFSSLLLLYQATEKPVLWQNVEVLDYGKRFVTDKLYYDGEYVWGTALEFNGLFQINPETYDVKYMGQFLNEKPEGYKLFYGIVECDGKLYFCPYNAKHIAVYDKKSRKFHSINLRKDIRDLDKKFCSILSHGKHIYLQGSRAYTILRIDTKTDEITYVENWVGELEENRTADSDFLIQRDGCVHNGNLYYFAPAARGLLCIKTNTLDYEFASVQYNSLDGFSEIINSKESLWLLPNATGFISCFNLQTSALIEIAKMKDAVSSCKVKEYIYYFSRSEPYFYRIHIDSKEVTKFVIGEGVYCSCSVGDKIFIATYLTGKLYIFDTVNLETVKTEFLIDDMKNIKIDILKMVEDNKKYNRYARESAFVNLNNLVEIDYSETSCKFKQEGSYGSKIHKYVKGVMK